MIQTGKIYAFLGLAFDIQSPENALASVIQLMERDRFSYVVTPNVDHVVKLHRNDAQTMDLWSIYRGAALCLCDSRILSRLARLSGLTIPTITGSDLTRALVERLNGSGTHVHVVGGSPDLLAQLQSAYPGIRWTQHMPPHGVLHDPLAQQSIIDSVSEAGAPLTLMAIGAPQSELVSSQVAASGEAVGVALCIGASLEFMTGEKSRAPVMLQELGLEWLYRLLSEPRRLWRRYLVEGPAIFPIWLRWHTQDRAITIKHRNG